MLRRGWETRGRARTALASLLIVGALSPLTTAATTSPSGGEHVAFEATPLSEPKYGVAGPESHTVLAADGVELHVDVWVPQAKDGNKPPKKLPVILIQSPYEDASSDVVGRSAAYAAHVGGYFAQHGYVVAVGSVRGTGSSGGCIDLWGPTEVSDTLRVVEYLARTPGWASGRVGMFGFSYSAIAALGAATSDDRARSRYIRVLVAGGGFVSAYDYSHLDGVPQWDNSIMPPFYRAFVSPSPHDQPHAAPALAERSGCEDQFTDMADPSGDYTHFYAAREYEVRNLRAPILLHQGLGDANVWPHVQAGFFDRIPAEIPHKVVVGQWEHDEMFASFGWTGHLAEGERRSDWHDLVRAWFDRYLMDLPTGVEDWPAVQVQGLNPAGIDGVYGRWREEAAWPTTGGPVGHLALGSGGVLGAATPTDSTQYRETSAGSEVMRTLGDAPAAAAVFETAALEGPLHLTGQPSLQLWVELQRSDAHITAVLEAFDADGNRIAATRRGAWQDTVFGARSARHLDPLIDGRLRQPEGRDADPGVPLLVPIRLKPVDLLVPEGGKVRVTVAGNFSYHGLPYDETIGSGNSSTVTILHDCAHTSVLRFLMPRAESRWLDVEGSPTSSVEQPTSVDGGGIATAPVCDQPPVRDDVIGPVRPY